MRKTLSVLAIFIISTHLFPQRIVSLTPAITEIIFALEEGDKLIGNTRFCDYPAEALQKKKIGGYLDMNLELLVSLNPDIIFHYPEHLQKLKPIASRFKLIELEHTNIDSIYSSIKKISRTLGVDSKGVKLITSIKAQLHSISLNPKKRKPKVLMVAGRNPDKLSRMYIVGKGDFLNELIELAGGINAYQGDIQYPAVSIESILKMEPDYIIDLAVMDTKISREKVMDLWKNFKIFSDNHKKKILVIKENFWVRPGPRIGKIGQSIFRFIQKK